MHALYLSADLATLELPDERGEAVALGQRITRLQARITLDRRRVAALHAQIADASGDREGAVLAARVVYLENDIAQHEVELAWWVARLEDLQPRRDRPRE
jgi:hypothetical protein